MNNQIFMDDPEGFYMSYFYCENLKKHTVRYWVKPYSEFKKVINVNGRKVFEGSKGRKAG